MQLSEREAAELARLKTVKGRHAQMLWLNGTRGHGKVALRVGPTEYWAYTSDPTEVAIREAEIAATTATCGRRSATLAKRGTRAHREPAGGEPAPVSSEPTSRATDRRPPRGPSRQRHAPPRRRVIARPADAEPPRSSSGATHDARARAPSAVPRAAAGGVRAVRRRRRQHARLSDRARRGTRAIRTGAGRRHRRAERRDRPATPASQAPRSLIEAAEHVAAGLPTGQLVATTADGLRVLATEPRFTLACAREGVELLLEHARERYALTVIDCGTLAREADQVALAKRLARRVGPARDRQRRAPRPAACSRRSPRTCRAAR